MNRYHDDPHGRHCHCHDCQGLLAEEAAEAMSEKPHSSGLTCIHAHVGLCPACRDEYEEDPLAWIEYGQHQQGILNWQSLQQEFLDSAAQESTPPEAWDEIPF